MRQKILRYFLILHLAIVFAFADLIPISYFPASIHEVIAVYSSWTGGGHGYSFFAPDVGYQNVAKCYTMNIQNKLNIDVFGSGETSFEVRMSSLIHSLYNSKVPELNARLLASYCFGKYSDAKAVEVSLGKYIVPNICDYNKGIQPYFEEYYRGTFMRNKSSTKTEEINK